MSKAQDEGREAARIGALRPVGTLVPAIVGAAAKRHGIAAADLLTAWPEIVGPELAGRCRPVKVSAGAAPGRREGGARGGRSLVLAARRAEALEIEYAAETIIRRVNAYLGSGAIGRIIVEPALREAPRARQKRPMPAPIRPDASGLCGIADGPLREALAKLQGAIRAERG